MGRVGERSGSPAVRKCAGWRGAGGSKQADVSRSPSRGNALPAGWRAGAVRVRSAGPAGHGKERGWAAGKPARKRPLILCKHSHKSDSWALCF